MSFAKILKAPWRRLAYGTGEVSSTNPLPVSLPRGVYATASFTPVAEAYGAADLIGSGQDFDFTFTDTGDPIPAGALIRILTAITRRGVSTVPSGQTSFQLQLYAAAEASPQANNAVWALASADLANYRGPVALGTPADVGAANYVRAPYVDLDVRIASGQTGLKGCRLVTDGAHTSPDTTVIGVTLYGVVL